MNVLRENILSEMNVREWNAYSLADESGVPQSTIQRFLSGKHTELRDSTVRKIAKGFKVPESKLRGFELQINKKINMTNKDSFDQLIAQIFDSGERETVRQIVEVTDQAYASKLFLQDNFGEEFTVKDVLKLTKLIVKNKKP